MFFLKVGDCFYEWGEPSFKGRNLFREQVSYLAYYMLQHVFLFSH
jgi:hypothetical protein